MDNNRQQWTTIDNNRQQWTKIDNIGQQWTHNRQQSAVLWNIKM